FARMEEAWDVVGNVSSRFLNVAATPASPRRFRASGLSWAAGIVLAVSALGWATWQMLHSRAPVLATPVGENPVLQLADGSQVTLGGATRVSVHFDERERSLEISQGEALFAVARDSARPFRVRAGHATVTAIGTEFNVRRSTDRVVVAVVEGRVAVASED